MERDTYFGDLWDRFRKVVQSVADVRALKKEARSNAEQIEASIREFQDRRSGDHDELDDKVRQWKQVAEAKRRKEEVFQTMLNYFLENEDPRFPPPEFGRLTLDQRQSYRVDQKIMAPRGKRSEIYEAILEVLKRDDPPGGKIAFYKAADRERGLSGKGRATENWIRDRMNGDLPAPEYWRSILPVENERDLAGEM